MDVHVHRITNRWGYVATATPEATMAALEAKLPRDYWIEINERLVPFGKWVCTGMRPKCPDCAMLSMCRQVGVAPPRASAGGGAAIQGRVRGLPGTYATRCALYRVFIYCRLCH